MVRDRVIVELASDIEKEEKYPKARDTDMVTVKGTEKRIILGKARTCKMAYGKINEVFDELSEKYLSLNSFLKLFNEKGERISIINAQREKAEKEKLEKQKVNVEKQAEVQKLPLNTLTTSNINLSTSGTSVLDISIPNTPDINVNVNAETKIGKIKNPDPFNWYIKKRLKY